MIQLQVLEHQNENYSKRKRFWKIVEDEYTEIKDWNALSMDPKKDMEDKYMKNNLAFTLIHSALSDSLFPKRFACASPQEA